MRTDDLIRALATDLEPERPMTGDLWLGLGLALAFCIALVGVVLGYRVDLWSALVTPVSALRPILALALFGFALRIALLLARPEGRPLVRYRPLLGVAALAIAAVVWALVTTPQAELGTALRGTTLVWCLSSIPVLSIIPVWVLFATLRRGATSAPGLLGAIAGLAGSSAGAAAYTLHCSENSPLFYVTWYGLAIAIVTIVSSLIGSRLLRW